MKKTLILAAVAALALSACSKNEIIETINKVPENQMVGFSSYTPKAITKADANYYVDGSSVTNLVSGKTFGVYAWAKENKTTPWSKDNNLFDGSGNPEFMVNVPVTFNGNIADGSTNISSAGYYSDGNPVRYWPSGDTPDGLSFFAYYPTNATGLTRPVDGSGEETGLGNYTFKVQSSAANQIDFMVSEVVADQYYGLTNKGSSYKNTVNFTFHHTLTKVQFKFVTDADHTPTTVHLTGATLSGIYDTNVLATSYTAGGTQNTGTTTYAFTPANASSPVGFNITVNNGIIPDDSSHKVLLSTTATTVEAKDAFLMVPQTISAGQQKITINWEVTTAGVTTKNVRTIDLNNIKAAGDVHIDWGQNNQVTYTITIGPKPIYFTATVAGWDTETNGAISVN